MWNVVVLTPPPLWVPDWPLPPYRYVPGVNPHPFRHPDGHLYVGGGAPVEAPWDSALPWREDRRWLRGFDLLHHRYAWEAHEVWEALWHQAPHPVLKGLIQLAAAQLKRHMGDERAADTLVASAKAQLAGDTWRGLDLAHARAACDTPWPILRLG